MSDIEILQLERSIQKELIEINVILEKIFVELVEITTLSDRNGKLGKSMKKAKESFVPLCIALGITAENSAKQGENPPIN